MMTLVSPDGRYVVFSSSALSLLNMTRRFDEMMLVSTSFEAKVQYQNPARALRRSWFSQWSSISDCARERDVLRPAPNAVKQLSLTDGARTSTFTRLPRTKTQAIFDED